MMYHSVWFRTVPTRGNNYTSFDMYDDYGLVPTTRPVIPPPGVKTHSIDIPGTNGSVDLTESLTPYPLYQNRTGSIEFAVINEHYHWANLYSELMNNLHGRRALMVLEDDRNWFYDGRFAINSWNTGSGTCPTVTIDYDVGPYKIAVNSSKQMDETDWYWDPFNFYDGIIPSKVSKNYTATGIFTNLAVNSSSWTEIGVLQSGSYTGYGFDAPISGWMPVAPALTISNSGIGIKVENDQIGYSYEKIYDYAGTYIDPDLLLYDWVGGYSVWLKGSGTVSFDFRKGSL